MFYTSNIGSDYLVSICMNIFTKQYLRKNGEYMKKISKIIGILRKIWYTIKK